jgi:hypothetical protein
MGVAADPRSAHADNDTLNALVSWCAGIVLIDLVAPHAGELGLHSRCTHRRRSAALLGHCLDARGFSFGNQALIGNLCIGCSFGGGLLVRIAYSGRYPKSRPKRTQNN